MVNKGINILLILTKLVNIASNRKEKIEFLKCCQRQMWRMGKDFGACALCSQITLAPKDKKNVRFVLSS